MENSYFYDQTFGGEGTKFNCKLVGITDVVCHEGEDMCAEAFKQLKVQTKKKKEHKQKVALFVSLADVRIVDENTQEVQYLHPVKMISYVTIDHDESKIFGYVCSQPDCPTRYQFYALKSEENAQVIVDAMVELFQVSFNDRQDHARSGKKQVPHSSHHVLNGSVELIAQLQQMKLDASKASDKKDLKIELKKIASDKGFRIVDNEGSGNCMFYALSNQLEIAMRIKIKHDELRQVLVQYLRKNPKLPNGTNLFHFVHGHQTWADYLTYMEQDGAWGDHVILCAAANCYKTCIRVVSTLNAAHDVILRPECPVDKSSTLVLGHIHEVHYVSLHSTQAKQTELEEMETRPTNLQGQPRGKEKQLQAKDWQNLSLQTLCSTTNQPMEEKIRKEENLYLIRLRTVEEQLAHSQGQLREKELEQANLLREKEQQNNALHQKLTNLEGQLREKESLKDSMQEQLNRKIQLVGNLEEQLKTKDRERIEIEKSLSAAQSALRVHRAQVVTLERQLMTKDQEKHELERTLAAAQ